MQFRHFVVLEGSSVEVVAESKLTELVRRLPKCFVGFQGIIRLIQIANL